MKKKRKPLLDVVDLKGKGAPIGEGPYGSSNLEDNHLQNHSLREQRNST
jgi:hypothetical protein